MTLPLLLGLATMVGGGALLVSLVAGSRRTSSAAAYLAGPGIGIADGPTSARPAPAVGPLARLRHRIAPLLRASYVEQLATRLETAGRGRAMSAEEVATAQVVLGLAGLAAALFFVAAARPTPAMSLAALLLLPGCGALGPKAWVERAARERQGVVRKDLPDVLDLLAISVEAGLGFEAALDLAARNFAGPLADEIRRALREMELGTSRHDALHAMKRRVDVPELSNFVLALTQADALGMPIGRVLHAQATELRARRRQWAREKAGKMPIKILFPLVGFIFPPLMAVLLGPAASSILKALR
jgi:tight adherence protein C